jgi:hypothetical protein
MTRTEEIEKEVKALSEKQKVLWAERKSIKDKEVDNRIAPLLSDPKAITLKTAMSINMHSLGNGIGSKWWKVLDIYFNELTIKGEILEGLYREGSNPDAEGQAYFDVKLDQNRPIDNQRGLFKVLPYIKSHLGIKRFGIFEHTCSQYGSYSLRITEDHKEATVVRVTYGRPTETFKGSVEKAFQHIYEYLPYEVLDTEKEEDEEW